VKLLPTADPWWPKALSFSPWVAVAACGALGAFLMINNPGESEAGNTPVVAVESGEKWIEIQEVADAELLVAAADHLDSFSDQELVSLIGF
jgi:hypothetical protein